MNRGSIDGITIQPWKRCPGWPRKERIMGKCWIIDDEQERIMPLTLLYLAKNFPGIKLTEYPSNPLAIAKEKLESIICLAAEGPDVESHANLFQAILKEALIALKAMEGK